MVRENLLKNEDFHNASLACIIEIVPDVIELTVHPKDNFSWVPNCSLRPPKCETRPS